MHKNPDILDMNRMGDMCPGIELGADEKIPDEGYRGILLLKNDVDVIWGLWDNIIRLD